MRWDQFNELNYVLNNSFEKETNIECPKCGKNIYLRNDIVLTTYPPQYSYFCKNCDWTGSSFTKYSN